MMARTLRIGFGVSAACLNAVNDRVNPAIPRLQTVVDCRFRADSGLRRVIPFLVIGSMERMLHPSRLSEFIFVQAV